MEATAMGEEDENIKKVRSVLRDGCAEQDILRAPSHCNDIADTDIDYIVYKEAVTVKRVATSTGARVSTHIKREDGKGSEGESVIDSKPKIEVKEEPFVGCDDNDPVGGRFAGSALSQKSASRMSFDEFLHITNTKVMSEDEPLESQIEQERPQETPATGEAKPNLKVKAELDVDTEKISSRNEVLGSDTLKSSDELVVTPDMTFQEYLRLTEAKVSSNDKCLKSQIVKQAKTTESEAESCCGSKAGIGVKEESKLGFDDHGRTGMRRNQDLPGPLNVKKESVGDKRPSTVVIEDGDFPVESDWLLVGRTVVTGLSTTKGRKLEDNEIVHFAFPSDSKGKCSSNWESTKVAAASSAIVRFSTKRHGEVISISISG